MTAATDIFSSLHRISTRTVAALLLAFTAASASSQTYPVRPVRIIVPYAPGANADLIARLISQRLSPMWGQQVLLDNRPGAATNIGSTLAARAPPDGYTLLLAGPPNAINIPLMGKTALRPAHRLQRGYPVHARPERAFGASIRARAQSARAHRARESAAGPAQLRLGRHRIGEPDGRRAFEDDRKDRHRARALQRQRPADHRCRRRARRTVVCRHLVSGAAYQEWKA